MQVYSGDGFEIRQLAILQQSHWLQRNEDVWGRSCSSFRRKDRFWIGKPAFSSAKAAATWKRFALLSCETRATATNKQLKRRLRISCADSSFLSNLFSTRPPTLSRFSKNFPQESLDHHSMPPLCFSLNRARIRQKLRRTQRHRNASLPCLGRRSQRAFPIRWTTRKEKTRAK